MPTTFVKSDILEEAMTRTEPRALVFGADCTGTMDAGIAVAVRQRWPELAEAFRAHCANGKFQLGNVFAWRPGGEGNLVIFALGLQSGGGKSKISTLERAMRTLMERVQAEGLQFVLAPRLGAGKNGLDWVRVKRILGEITRGTPVNLVVFEQFVRKTAPQASEP